MQQGHSTKDTGRAGDRPSDPLRRLLKVEPSEGGSLAWSCAYFFCVLGGYYILRPFRDEMGAAGGVDNLKWLYLGTLGSMVVASFLFAGLTTRFPRGSFIPYVYRFFAINLLIFFALLKLMPAAGQVPLGRVIFVWTSVYNLFVVSVFWSFMADVFTNPQGKRLFGFIAMGGTFGHICGSYVAEHSQDLGAVNLLLITVVLLEAACFCVGRLNAIARRRADVADGPRSPDSSLPSTGDEGRGDRPIEGGPFAGLALVLRSPYLLGIVLFMLCYTVTSTFLYITRLEVGLLWSDDPDARVAFYARINLWTGVLTMLGQIFLTSRLIGRLGVGLTLGILPAITLVGFAILGTSFVHPELLATVWVLMLFETIRRAGNFAFSRPAREVLYTVVGRQEKYKAKNLIDTFVYRAGDQVGVWAHGGLSIFLGAAAIAFAMVPLAAVWFAVAIRLGRRQRSLAAGNR